MCFHKSPVRGNVCEHLQITLVGICIPGGSAIVLTGALLVIPISQVLCTYSIISDDVLETFGVVTFRGAIPVGQKLTMKPQQCQ
jgi:hypothetical protein